MSSPFICGRPAVGNEFINRKNEIRGINNRLSKGESSAITGEAHIGKTSLLLELKNPDTAKHYLGKKADNFIFSYCDLHPASENLDYSQSDFWKAILEPLTLIEDDSIKKALSQASLYSYSNSEIQNIFKLLAKSNLKLIALLDEFDCLIQNPNFKDKGFFTFFRSTITTIQSLVIVTATRMSVAELHRQVLISGSPFLNFAIEFKLKGFDDQALSQLLGLAGEKFNGEGRKFIRRVAGTNPFLVQTLADVLYELPSSRHSKDAGPEFYSRISWHFDDIWNGLDDNTRTTAVILGLIEFGKRALGNKFACGEIENVDKFGPELRKLENFGLAEIAGKGWQFDTESLLLWREEKWTLSSQAFAWWIRDIIVAENRTFLPANEWLKNRKYSLFLTQGQWNWLYTTLKSIPKSTISGVADLAFELYKSIAVKKT